jgi:cob(I)alamin adenosyltransferase
MTERGTDRLTDIVTRTGDDGRTGLADGRRVAKHDPRIEAIGAVDELNSFLGLLLTEALPEDIDGLLTAVQNDLFDLGGELALPDHPQVSDAHIARLDTAIAGHNAQLPPLREFVLPGGGRAAAQAHVCRSVCRRAERRLATLAEIELLSPRLLQYLNRLSDLLFILARVLNRRTGVSEACWRRPGKG